MTCGRVIIIDHGKIRASDTPQNLVRRLKAAGAVTFEMKGDAAEARVIIEKIPGVKEVEEVDSRKEWTTLAITTDSNVDVREDIFVLAVEHKWAVRELTRHTASLEDAFCGLGE